MIRKSGMAVVVALCAVCAGFTGAVERQEEQALNKLMEGNKRFVGSKPCPKGDSGEKRKELLAGQHPSAIVVACSDSRVPPEVIFDQSLGDLFVVRVAGNVIDPVTLGSIEYAAEHLHTPLLVIMGHEKCGAVSASLETTAAPGGNIGAVVAKILPAVEKAKARGGSKDDMVNNAIRENVLLAHATALKDSAILRHLMETGRLKVIDAIYHLESGAVEVLAQSTPAALSAPTHATTH